MCCRYLDRYRDRKEIAEEVIKEHLREITPYKSLEDQRLPYPLATPTKPGYYVDQLDPTWLKKVKTHKINKNHKILDFTLKIPISSIFIRKFPNGVP